MTIDRSSEPALQGNAEQVDYWNSAAGLRWAALQERIDAAFAPLTAAALDFAAPRQGAAVIDIGCGAGATILGLAARVGPSGRVLGVDVSEPMLAVAARRIASENLDRTDVVLADAATQPFERGAFDLAFSRFGVMFFADPVAAFANVRTALVSGGRLAFACWRPLADNPWFAVPVGALKPLLPPAPPSDPWAPGPFAFADPDRVRGLLAAAGFEHVAIEPHDTIMRLGDLPAALDFVSQIGPASRALNEADAERRPALIEALRAALGAHDGPDGVVLGGAIWLVSARSKD